MTPLGVMDGRGRRSRAGLLGVVLLLAGCVGSPSSSPGPGGTSIPRPSTGEASPRVAAPPSSLDAGTPGFPCDPVPTGEPVETAYRNGRATLTISTGEVVELGLETLEPSIFSCGEWPFAGAYFTKRSPEAEWDLTVGANWLIDLVGQGSSKSWQVSVDIQAYRSQSAPGQRLRSVDQEVEQGTPVCEGELTRVSPAGLAGSAECHGLLWMQEIGAVPEGELKSPYPTPYQVGPPVDISITFEALP